MSSRTAVPPYRRTAGFTLVEVLVALVLAGTAALLAHGLFSAAVGASAGLRVARRSLDRAANADRFLGSAFLSLDVGQSGSGAFAGEPERVRFSTWLETRDGWRERREVVLELQDNRLIAAVAPEPPIVLSDSVVAVGFDYLLQPGAESAWVREWQSPVSSPLAVRVRVTRHAGPAWASSDTVVYLIKARG